MMNTSRLVAQIENGGCRRATVDCSEEEYVMLGMIVVHSVDVIACSIREVDRCRTVPKDASGR